MNAIEKLEKENKRFKEENVKLKSMLNALWEENQRLKEENNSLRNEVDNEKRNEPPFKFRKKKTTVRHKKSGRKKGHKGVIRPLPEKADEEDYLTSDSCPKCKGKNIAKLNEQKIRYIEDIEFENRIVRKRIVSQVYYCRTCKVKFYRKPNDVLPNCRIGLNAALYATKLKYRNRMPLNLIRKELIEDFGLNITEATLANLIYHVAKVLKPKYEEFRGDLRKSDSSHNDETSWGKDWLWAFSSKDAKVTIYDIGKRNNEVAKRNLGEDYNGVSISDFFSAYGPLNCKKQRDYVHLLRMVKKAEEKHPYSKEVPTIKKKIKRIIDDAIRLKEKQPQPKILERETKRLKRRFLNLSEQKYRLKRCKNIVELIKKHQNELLTFINENCDWNNNRGERKIRPNVIIRKISGPNKSEKGKFSHKINMSVLETCKDRGLNFVDFAKYFIQNTALG